MNTGKAPSQSDVSPLADIGFFINVDGCEITAQAIHFLLAKLPVRDRWCVEFGAGGEAHGSTTHRLITGQNYSAVLIEGVPGRFADVTKRYQDNSRVKVLQKFVSFESGHPDSLDRLLAGSGIPRDFDFLSIDIDGNDYHVWNAIKEYTPKILMIEFNPTISAEVDFVQPADPGINWGNSLAALNRLAKLKSYELVSVIGVNALFVQRQYFPLFDIGDNRIETLWTKRDCVTHIFCDYNGRLHLIGNHKLPWHYGIQMRESRLQVLPKFLQKYRFERADKITYLALREPWTLLKKNLGRFTGK